MWVLVNRIEDIYNISLRMPLVQICFRWKILDTIIWLLVLYWVRFFTSCKVEGLLDPLLFTRKLISTSFYINFLQKIFIYLKYTKILFVII